MRGFLAAAWAAFPFLLPLAAFWLMYWLWSKRGMDPDLGAIVPQYEPPDGFGPAETLAIIRQESDGADLAPTIIDLASRGYLRLTRLPDDDYLLESLQPRETWKDLKPFEALLLDRLFPGERIDRQKLSELQARFSGNLDAFRDAVMDQLVMKGYFPANPGGVSSRWFALGVAIAFLSVFAAVGGWPLFLSVLATGVIIAAFGRKMGHWNAKGAAAAAQAMGFREFISQVEKYRAPWMEEQGAMERLLPYAIAFGLGGKWVETFSALQMEEPDWYQGDERLDWSTRTYVGELGRFTLSFLDAVMSEKDRNLPNL